ncbi:hypothetical protein TWF481_006442 [Arthrobotrys musiformis]|uniref:Alpha/beta hydrolase fold-3 domain-containing protein n=1 Tax=Arthrobotrys musiformis TaxID=47236 RepID=A0AAV9WIP9_9PEZI
MRPSTFPQHFPRTFSQPVFNISRYAYRCTRSSKPLPYPQPELARSIALQRVQFSSSTQQLGASESLRDTYDEDHIEFYRKNIAQKRTYNPFDNLDAYEHYPCEKDYQPDTLQSSVSCKDFVLSRKATGSILLRIYNSSNATSKSPVIIYLPSRGTNPLPTTNEHYVISLLTRLTNATTICVGYRVSPPFPLSLHDALAAIDWARANVPTVSLDTYCQNNYDGRLMAVLGTGIGGSLAASIGATEGRESGIVATGAWLPIVDWAFDPLPGIPESSLSTIPRSLSSLEKYSQSEVEGIEPDLLPTYSKLADNPFLSSETLKSIRSTYLANPEDFTDPFASPLYRFSSSGVNIWTNLISRIKSELLADPENPPAWIDKLPNTIFKRGPRRPIPYPPLDLVGKLTVPMMRVVSAEGDILHQQITEYVHAARSSMFPTENKTIEEIEREEALELGKTHNNDIWEPKRGVGWNITEQETSDSEPEKVAAPDVEGVGRDSINKLETLQTGSEGEELVNSNLNSKLAAEEADSGDLKYGKGAETYIQHEIIPKAGHCLITGAGEIGCGIKEIESMAIWINSVFTSEPRRAMYWKSQQEVFKKSLEAALTAKRKRVSKL